MSKRTCKGCKKKFERLRSNQVVCSFECSIDYTNELKEKKEAKDWRVKKKRIKESLKTHSDYTKELQVVFNKYIRLRDKGKPCISCNRVLGSKQDCGHYRSVGSCPELRFSEKNTAAQCVFCNQHQHGNLIEYRKGLIKKLGVEEVELLENYHIPMKHSIPELIEMKVIYKDKIKKIEKSS